jgi:hypothetical protein
MEIAAGRRIGLHVSPAPRLAPPLWYPSGAPRRPHDPADRLRDRRWVRRWVQSAVAAWLGGRTMQPAAARRKRNQFGAGGFRPDSSVESIIPTTNNNAPRNEREGNKTAARTSNQ